MRSAGYDLVLSMHKNLYNKILIDLFKTNVELAKKTGKILSYSLTLKKPPVVESFIKNQIEFNCELRSDFSIFNYLKFSVSPAANLIVSINYLKNEKKIQAKLVRSHLSPASSDVKKLGILGKVFYRLVDQLFGSRLSQQYEKIALPSNLYAFTLPEMPSDGVQPLDVDVVNITAVNNDVISICANLLGRVGGNSKELSDFTDGQDIAFCLSFDAITRVESLFWKGTNSTRVEVKEGRLDVKQDILLNVLTQLRLAFDDALIKHTIPRYHQFVDSWIDYRISARFPEPTFKIAEGNKIDIPNIRVILNLDAKLQLRKVKTVGNVETDDIVTAATFSENNLDLMVKSATAKLIIDKGFKLLAKIEKLDVDFDLKWGLPDVILDAFVDEIEDHIVGVYPTLVLSPAMFSETIPGTALKFDLDLGKIMTYTDEIIVLGSVDVK
jgi:hypothetical protein